LEKTAEGLVEEVERLKTTERLKGLKKFVEKCAVSYVKYCYKS